MAEQHRRTPENVPGPYYVDDSCVDCGLCPSSAPQIFIREDLRGYTYVHRQPQTPEEVAAAEEAREACPTESIGNDGTPECPGGAKEK